MKKILIIADYYRPGYKAGGPIKSIYNIAENLKKSFDIFILTRNHDFNDEIPYEIEADKWVLKDNINIYYDSNNLDREIFKKIQMEKFDYIYLNSFFSRSTINFLKNYKNLKSKIILSPRGELANGALKLNRTKKKLFLNFIKIYPLYKNVIFIGSNNYEANEIKIYFPRNEINIISNLSNISNKQFINNKKSESIKLFFVSRINRKKNLDFLFKILNNLKGNVELSIIGPAEDVNYYNELLKLEKKLNSNIKIEFLGSIPPTEIYNYIKDHDYFVLPTLNENYGHVISEALEFKKPVILSDNTPWSDYVIKNELGKILPLQKEIWTNALNQLINEKYEKYQLYEEKFNNVNQDLFLENENVIKRYEELFS